MNIKNVKVNKIVSIIYATIAAILFIILSAISVAACAGGNGDFSDESGNMNIDYGEDGAIRNGTEYYTFQVEEGYKGEVLVTISKKSGVIDLDIYPTDRKDDKEYMGRGLDSASFSVILTKPGEYKVRITAKEFVGDYGISWKTEKNEGEQLCVAR